MNDIELSQAQRDLLRDRLSKYCAETVSYTHLTLPTILRV